MSWRPMKPMNENILVSSGFRFIGFNPSIVREQKRKKKKHKKKGKKHD